MKIGSETRLVASEAETAECQRLLPAFLQGGNSDWLITRLPGLTNRSYLLRRGDQALVLRVPRLDTATNLNRKSELHNASIAARLGIAPEICHMDTNTGVLVTVFLEGSRPLTPKDLADPRTQDQIAAAIRLLQSCGEPFEGLQDPQTAIDQYLGMVPDVRAKRIRQALAPALARLRSELSALAPSHVDPHPSNILRRADGSLAIIDWEYSATADRHWDVAAVLNAMPDDEAVARRFMRLALGTESETEFGRLRAFQVVLNLVAGSWAAMEASVRKDANLERLASEYLDRCEETRALGYVEAWVRTAGNQSP